VEAMLREIRRLEVEHKLVERRACVERVLASAKVEREEMEQKATTAVLERAEVEAKRK
jgi:hypothetical protein